VSKIKDLLKLARFTLKDSPSSYLDAKLLLGKALGLSKLQLITGDFKPSEAQIEAFNKLVEKRCRGVPVAYLLEEKEFYGLTFKVNEDVLIPRPESEELVLRALKILKEGEKKNYTVIDCGTGSGALILALLHELKGSGITCEAYGVDISLPALEIAKENEARLMGREKSAVKFIHSDWFRNVPKELTFDLVISNPPYVGVQEEVTPGVAYEPKEAIYALDNGLAGPVTVIKEALPRLKENGRIICEIGITQGREIRQTFSREEVRLLRCLNGQERFIEIQSCIKLAR
jgi:release factor glutamine methyltransferase